MSTTARNAFELSPRPEKADRPPLVSIVIPFLNAGQFLREAIGSVFLQTYNRWELLLMDDGSTDGSTRIAEDYAASCPSQVFCFEHPGHENLGLPRTRNLGLQKARGRYLALLDADDVWLPGKLEDQVAILESHPDAAMVYGRSHYWKSWNGDSAEADYTPELGVPTNTLIAGQELMVRCYPLGKAVTPCPSDLLFRRSALEKARAFEDWPFNFYEDQAFLAKIYLENLVYVSDACWDKYRLHPDSCSAVVFGSGQYDQFRRFYFEWLEGRLRQKNVGNEEIWNLLRQAQRQYGHPLVRRMKRISERFRKHESSPQPAGQVTRPLNKVSFGDLRRLEPISRNWGYDRGVPIDRHYIESFLADHADDIRGRVLEIGDAAYTRKFGGDRVSTSDVLHVSGGNPKATIVGDLVSAPHIPSDAFDCVILTQTLQLIYDTRAALRTCFRILKPGGVLLATFPGISQIDSGEWGNTWYWAFTTRSAKRLFEEIFAAPAVEVQSHGNVLTSICFLHGLPLAELRQEELNHSDPQYQMLITVRAKKGHGPDSPASPGSQI